MEKSSHSQNPTIAEGNTETNPNTEGPNTEDTSKDEPSVSLFELPRVEVGAGPCNPG
ncbi:MAG: hypothetical protein HXS48_23905 [Theionarchaea archaeon]|nr:hypothetical protein [Theionarchaea archaeon]